jgi:hypothetical protein
MTYTFSGSEIEPNTFAALMLSLAQNGDGSYKVYRDGKIHVIEFANGLKIECEFAEDASPLTLSNTINDDTGKPVQDDVYTFCIFNADSEMYSH